MDWGTAIFGALTTLAGTLVGGGIGYYSNRQQFKEQERQDNNARLISKYENLIVAAEKYRARAHFFAAVGIIKSPAQLSESIDIASIIHGADEEPTFIALKEAAQELHTAYTLLSIEKGHQTEVHLCVDMERMLRDYVKVIQELKTATFPYASFDKSYNDLAESLLARISKLTNNS